MEETIQYIIAEKKKDRAYAEIKAELLQKGMTTEEASKLIREADNQLLDSLTHQQGKPIFQFKYEKKFLGIALIIIGVAVTTLTYTGIIDLGNSYIIFYGPIVAGIGLLSYDSRKRLNESRMRFKSKYSKWKF